MSKKTTGLQDRMHALLAKARELLKDEKDPYKRHQLRQQIDRLSRLEGRPKRSKYDYR